MMGEQDMNGGRNTAYQEIGNLVGNCFSELRVVCLVSVWDSQEWGTRAYSATCPYFKLKEVQNGNRQHMVKR